ncbi:MAG: two-component system, NarL family, sensor kinase, partial [Propionibacteriaceae bacterium]|nr:two-component system, NarL family, sensor kinase [Propionibacteriaceae bacterium]
EGERLVFRIAQECLRNAARHAQADTVLLELRSVGNKVVLDVIDDGIGFDAEAAVTRPAEGHFGLRLMADATAQAHGQLRVRSAPGEGTHWQLRVPTP